MSGMVCSLGKAMFIGRHWHSATGDLGMCCCPKSIGSTGGSVGGHTEGPQRGVAWSICPLREWEHELHSNKPENVIATSVFIAILVWSVSAPKRSKDSRATAEDLAEDLLASLIGRLAESEFRVVFQR
eukprot:s394_g30.t1